MATKKATKKPAAATPTTEAAPRQPNRRKESVKYLVTQPEWGIPNLVRWGGPGSEWEDTDAEWGLGVLALYPEIVPPPAGCTHVGIGYGSLCACDARGQVAYWADEEGWVVTRQ